MVPFSPPGQPPNRPFHDKGADSRQLQQELTAARKRKTSSSFLTDKRCGAKVRLGVPQRWLGMPLPSRDVSPETRQHQGLAQPHVPTFPSAGSPCADNVMLHELVAEPAQRLPAWQLSWQLPFSFPRGSGELEGERPQCWNHTGWGGHEKPRPAAPH